MPQLERFTFETSRAAEYFTAKELEAQTGQPASQFAAVILKELIDNGIDAAESAGVAPEINVSVEMADTLIWITVEDNGPGIPAETVSRILNFTTRTSDKSAYRAPTRGAQGNAFKTVIGIPFALGCDHPVVIEARGVRHTIHGRLDLAGEPQTMREMETSSRQQGTRITVCLPMGPQRCDPSQWGRAFSAFNPHATVRIRVLRDRNQQADCESDKTDSYDATVDFPADKWRKFLPTDLTSAWWYSPEELARLIGLHNIAPLCGRRPLTLREFVKQFRGLSHSAKVKQVCDSISQTTLGEFGHDMAAVAQLLGQMRSAAQAPSPEVLGKLGDKHIRARFDEWYGVKRFWYRKAEGVLDGIPYLFAVAIAETTREGDVFTGVNFSPTFGDPFAETRLAAGEIDTAGVANFMRRAHVRTSWEANATNTSALVHLICPSLHFLDRGKSRLVLSRTMATALAGALWRSVQELYREGEQRNKDAAKHQRKAESREREVQKQTRRRQWNLKDAVFAVIPKGMDHASGNGASPVSAKTLHYQVRRLIQEYTDKELDYDYFSQDLLTQYRQQVEEPAGLYYDPRGVLYEPHTGRSVPMGTRAVHNYQFPGWLYNKILYIEKKGLWPPIQHAGIAEKYDMAVMASEGYATEAARVLFAHASRDRQYRLFVLHDADPDGYEIARTLREATDRMPGYQVEVTDLGLRYEEALEMGLQTEQFTRKKRLPAQLQLTEGEQRAFEGRAIRTARGKVHWDCTRVELNAFTSPGLLSYIERRLREVGAIDKVIPPANVLETRAATRYSERVEENAKDLVASSLNRILGLGSIRSDALAVALTAVRSGRCVSFGDARQWIEKGFTTDVTRTWEGVLDEAVDGLGDGITAEVRRQVEQYLRERLNIPK